MGRKRVLGPRTQRQNCHRCFIGSIEDVSPPTSQRIAFLPRAMISNILTAKPILVVIVSLCYTVSIVCKITIGQVENRCPGWDSARGILLSVRQIVGLSYIPSVMIITIGRLTSAPLLMSYERYGMVCDL